jgi:hypothetical protein
MRNNTEALEAIVDRNSLPEVLEALSQICYEKAEHIETNWLDTELAKAWRKAGEIVLKASIKAGEILP